MNADIGQHLEGGKMMKITFLILLLFLLVGCSNISNNNNPSENGSNISNSNNPSENDTTKDIYIMEIERFDADLDQVEFPVDFDEEVLKEIEPIDTNQKAKDVGTSIIEALHRDGKHPEYTLLSIVHYVENNAWQFEYSIDQRNVDVDDLIDCGALLVVIDGNKGILIKAWVTE